MIQIDIDMEVFEKLGEIAIPFVETSPNIVIRRILGLARSSVQSSESTSIENAESGNEKAKTITGPLSENLEIKKINQDIDKLRNLSSETHPAFLTFLMDKFNNTKGNYTTSNILEFMEEINLHLPNGSFFNPWMKAPYGGEKNGIISCQRTIEHFRQTRKFGCWDGRDVKKDCDLVATCKYHPKNEEIIKNKCDLRNGVIWKRSSPDLPYTYGRYYLEIIKEQLLKGHTIPLEPLLKVLYSGISYDPEIIMQFKTDFHFNEEEFSTLFAS